MDIALLMNSFPKVSETFLMNQVEALLLKGHNITIFAAQNTDEPLTHNKISEYDMLNLCTYTNPPSNYKEAFRRTLSSTMRHPTFLPEISKAIKSSRPGPRLANIDTFLRHGKFDFDVYHAHFGPIGEDWSFLYHSSKQLIDNDAPFIVSYYGYDASKVIHNNELTYDNVFDYSTYVTVLSEDMESNLVKAGCNQSKIKYNPLGIDTDFFAFRPREEPQGPTNLLIVSRLVEKKGVIYAIEAFDKLVDNVDISLTIVGDGPQRENISQRIRELELTDQINLVGTKPLAEVKKLLYDSHIFIMPCITDSEGSTSPTPTILLQAQSTGIPIVSTYHAGIPRIVDEGNSAILVPEQDANSLSDAILSIVNQPETWKNMGQAGRRYVEEEYSISALGDRLTNLYKKQVK